MANLLNNPAVQGGLIPFIVALAAALLLRPAGRFGAGLAVIAGFFATVAVIKLGIVFPPRSSTHKILVLALAAAPLGLILDLRPLSWRIIGPLLGIAGAAALLWVAWPVLNRREGLEWWLLAGGAVVYGGWLLAATDALHNNPRALAIAPALGFGVGGAALLGASASFGQLGLSLGAAAAAVALLYLITLRSHAGRTLTLPVALLVAMLGYASMVYAKLPWYALAPLALAPLAAYTPLPPTLHPRIQFVVVGLVALAIAGGAVFLTWQAEGGVPV